MEAAIRRGTSFGAPTLAESELAELIIEAVPSIEKVRLVNSGTEATMSAIRLARGYTGRPMIVKFAGNYHGHVDSLLVAAGSSAATLGVPNSPGVTEGTTRDTLVLPLQRRGRPGGRLGRHGPQIAAVIVEPVVGNMGCVEPTPEFRPALRRTDPAARCAADLRRSDDRLPRGLRRGPIALGHRPDLTTLGKIIGGGLPVGAYGGRADIMDHVLPAGKVFQAGTLSGNPLATAAGIATLDVLRDTNPYPQIGAVVRPAGGGSGRGGHGGRRAAYIGRVGSMMTLFFNPGPVTDWDTAARSDTRRYARYFWGMIDRGIYMPCSQFEAFFVSTAHTEEDIEDTIAAAREALGTTVQS